MWWVDASVLAVLVTQPSGPELAHVGVLIDEDAEAWSRGQKAASEDSSQSPSSSAPRSPRSIASPAPPPYLHQRGAGRCAAGLSRKARRWRSSIGDARCHGPPARRP